MASLTEAQQGGKRTSMLKQFLTFRLAMAAMTVALATCGEAPSGEAARKHSVATKTVYQFPPFERPTVLVEVDSFVVVLTPYDRPSVRVVDLEKRVVINTLDLDGPRGRSFLRAVIAIDDTIWIADAGRMEVVAIPTTRVAEPLEWDSLMSIPIPFDFMDVLDVNSEGIAFSSGVDRGAYFVIDRTGRVVHNIESPNAVDLPDTGIRPFMGQISFHPSREYYVSAGKWESGVSLYRKDGVILVDYDVPVSFGASSDVSARMGTPSVIPTRDARVAYLDAIAKPESFIALFSGMHHFPAGESAFRGSDIHEYDYDGNYIIHTLEKSISSIAPSSNGQRSFYAIAPGDTASIVDFVLPTIRTPERSELK